MIRAWRARRRAADVVAVAKLDLRDGRIEGLQDALRESQQQLAIVRGELATYKARELMHRVLLYRRLHAAEPTEVTPVEQLHAVRPAPATEQYRRPQ